MAKKKKKKKRERAAEPVAETPDPGTAPAPARPRKRGGFFWGLTLGFVATLAVVVGNDLGWSVLPESVGREASATPVQEANAGTPLVLAGALPPQSEIYIDGQSVGGATVDGGHAVTVPPGAKRLEVRGANGPLWTTSIAAGVPDTLRPKFGGDLVVEAGRQSPRGTLWIDGEPAGPVPGTVSGVAPGWHLLSVRDGERVLYEDAVTVHDGEVSVVSIPPLPPRGKGRVVVRTRLLGNGGFQEVQGLPVWIDGVLRGETPFEATLGGGFHSVRVEQEDGPSCVEVVYLEAGSSRYVNAEFGDRPRLEIAVSAPARAAAGSPLALPVQVRGMAPASSLTEANLHIVRRGQARPLSIPLVPSGIGDEWWVAVLPKDLVSAGTLTGYASCTDAEGTRGDSDLFSLSVK